MRITEETMAREKDTQSVVSTPTVDYDTAGRLREKKRLKKRKIISILSFIGCMLLFIVVMAASVGLYIWVDERVQENAATIANLDAQAIGDASATYTQAELEERIAQAREEAKQEGAQEVLDSLEANINNSTLVEALRPLYEDKLIVASSGQYHFVPINQELKMNSYVNENLQILDNGMVEYTENGQVVSHKGIDVSKHQGEIDWEKVAADGVEFAFIRVGNRGYGSGAIVEDTQFEANIKGAVSNGIKVGVYFFSQAISVEEAIEEANFVLEKIAPYKIECPVVLDVEKVSDSEARMNKISTQERTANTIAFLEAVKAAGYEVMLYHNMEMGTLMLDLAQLEEYDKWFAYYNKELYYPYAYDVWQYSDAGKVNGISGDVDLNISFKMWD